MESIEFDSLGTTDDHAGAVYGLLLRHPEWNVGQVAENLGLGVDDTKKLLDRLVEIALLRQSDDDSSLLTPASPVMAMHQLIDRERELLETRHQALRRHYDAISSALSHYTAQNVAGDGSAPFESVDGIDAIRRRLEDLAVQCQREVLSFSPTAPNPRAARDPSLPLNRSVLARGVSIRTIYPDTMVYDQDALSYGAELQKDGTQIAVTGEIPLRMIIVDRRVAVLPNLHPGRSDGAILVREPSSLAALVALFETYWARAAPVRCDQVGAPECSAIERQVLRALATGSKDAAVARQLNISVRTVRRVISELMTRGKAESRFELGVHAVARGWIGP